MKLSKVKLRHKVSGVILKINEEDWVRDLGMSKYLDYERVGEINSGRVEDVVDARITSEGLQDEADKATTEQEPEKEDVDENSNEAASTDGEQDEKEDEEVSGGTEESAEDANENQPAEKEPAEEETAVVAPRGRGRSGSNKNK